MYLCCVRGRRSSTCINLRRMVLGVEYCMGFIDGY